LRSHERKPNGHYATWIAGHADYIKNMTPVRRRWTARFCGRGNRRPSANARDILLPSAVGVGDCGVLEQMRHGGRRGVAWNWRNWNGGVAQKLSVPGTTIPVIKARAAGAQRRANGKAIDELMEAVDKNVPLRLAN